MVGLLAPALARHRGEHARGDRAGEPFARTDQRQQPEQYRQLPRIHPSRPREIAQIEFRLLVADLAGEIDGIAPVVLVQMGVRQRHCPRLAQVVHAGVARVLAQYDAGPVDRAANEPFRLRIGQLVFRLAQR